MLYRIFQRINFCSDHFGMISLCLYVRKMELMILKRNIKNYLILIIFASGVFSGTLVAQELKHFTTGGGAGFSKLRNTNMSPLLYSGISGHFELGYSYIKEKRMIGFRSAFFGGKLKPGINPELSSSEMSSLRLNLQYRHLYKINFAEIQKLRLYAGFGMNNRDHVRIHNKFNNNNYDGDYNVNLSFTSTLSKALSVFERKTFITLDFSMPLISYMIGPSYSHPEPWEYLTDPDPNIFTFMKSGKFFTIDRYFLLNTRLNFFHFLNNGNAIGFSYEWEYLRNDAYNHLVSAGHHFSFTTLFNLKKDE